MAIPRHSGDVAEAWADSSCGLPHTSTKKENSLKRRIFKKNAFDERLSAPTVLAVDALQKVLEPLPRSIRRLRVIAGCRGRAATLLQRRRRVARRCAENYVESATGTEGSIAAAAVDVAIGKKIFCRRPRTGGRAAARRDGDGAA